MPACSSPPAEIELELPPDSGSVSEARAAVGEFARSVGVPAEGVTLAISEAVSNCVIHAFRDRDGGRIQVRAWVAGGSLLVRVADDGMGMVPHLDSPGLGVGASLISQVAREAKFESSERGTTVTMTFDLESESAWLERGVGG